MKRRSVSLFAWLLICATVVTLFLPSFYINRTFIKDKGAPSAVLLKHWEVRYEADTAEWSNRWQPFGPEEWERLSRYKGSLWVRRELPPISWSNPYLFAAGMNRFEAFLNGESVYRFHMDPGPVHNLFLATLHPIPIAPEDEGKELSLHILWDRLPFNAYSWILAGEPEKILTLLLRQDIPRYIFSVLYLTVGLVGLVLLARRRDKLYGWFTLLALSAGLGLLLLCFSLQWFLHIRVLYYWRELLLPFGTYAFIGFLAEVLGAARRPLLRITKGVLLLCVLAEWIVGLVSPYWYWTLLNDIFPWLAACAFVAVGFALMRYKQPNERRDERKWLIRGYTALLLCAAGYMANNLNFYTFATKLQLPPYLQSLSVHLLPNGLFLFLLAMVMILFHRIGSVYRDSERNARELREKNNELERFHRNLEQLVDIRTEELAEANRSLTITLREKAETLAEVSVLEERNRIAHEMHDVVGHTLTAAIVQLEASKKLATKDGQYPMDKLDIVNGLVRKGLDDVRRAVRMLKSDSIPTRLDKALRELIDETIQTMEVAIEVELDIPQGLGKLAERVIYRALQEGLTNGIRHGRCSRFRYTIATEMEEAVIRLWNDGRPFGFAKPGFGLTTMRERIHLLGGTMSIGSGEDGTGCELAIRLPLRAPEPTAGSA
ncbi:sensor histidine kinase [Cohnella boryungensis]|uniref:histidine kinase n=1 Tax=Cohnella boryungensis TaxID=768479 RepID=A0ABV8S451_9BACL